MAARGLPNLLPVVVADSARAAVSCGGQDAGVGLIAVTKRYGVVAAVDTIGLVFNVVGLPPAWWSSAARYHALRSAASPTLRLRRFHHPTTQGLCNLAQIRNAASR